MKRVPLILLFLLLCNSLYAQLFKFGRQDVGFIYIGPKFGANLSQISNWNEYVGDVNNHQFGFQVGAIGEMGLTNMLSVGGELLFIRKGHKVNSEFANLHYKMPYLGIPLLAKLSFPIFGLSKVYLKGGTFTNIRTGGTETWSFNEQWDDHEDEVFPVQSEDWKRIDWGLSIGFGANYKVKYGVWEVDLNYDHGFINTYMGYGTTENHKNRSFTISAVYKYDMVKLMLRLRQKHINPDA